MKPALQQLKMLHLHLNDIETLDTQILVVTSKQGNTTLQSCSSLPEWVGPGHMLVLIRD